jgi:hypothetical protein
LGGAVGTVEILGKRKPKSIAARRSMVLVLFACITWPAAQKPINTKDISKNCLMGFNSFL